MFKIKDYLKLNIDNNFEGIICYPKKWYEEILNEALKRIKRSEIGREDMQDM